MTVRTSFYRRALYALYQPYKLLIYGPILVVNTLVMGSVAALLSLVMDPRRVSLSIGVTWARISAFFIPMGVTVSGRHNVDPQQSYVVVSNHQSHVDVLVLYGWLGVDFRWVMKQELRKVPGLGVACASIGHIFIDRSNRQAAIASLEAAREQITGGTSVLFFPEGTRSRGGELGSFKKGAFRMAVDLDLPILPITIVGSRSILPPKTKRLYPGRASMVIHPPFAVDGYDTQNLGELMERVHEVVGGSLGGGWVGGNALKQGACPRAAGLRPQASGLRPRVSGLGPQASGLGLRTRLSSEATSTCSPRMSVLYLAASFSESELARKPSRLASPR